MSALRYLIYFLILLAVVQSVEAGTIATSLNGNITGFYNLSVVVDQGAYIPWELWLSGAVLGVALLVLSILTTPEQGNDILAILGIMPLAWSSWGALQIAFIHSGVFGMIDPTATNQTNVVMLTQVLVYPEAGLALIFLAFTIISILNLYRILLLNRTRDREVTPPSDDESKSDYEKNEGDY